MLFASANDGCQLEGGFAFGLFDKYGPRAAVGQMEEGCFVAVVDAQCHAVGHSAVPTEGHNLAFGGVCAVGGETYCLLAHSTLWVNLLAKIQTKSVPDTPPAILSDFQPPQQKKYSNNKVIINIIWSGHYYIDVQLYFPAISCQSGILRSIP